ncbi:MAG: class I SAM-dependent methyltransferase [Nakamurella sp.]
MADGGPRLVPPGDYRVINRAYWNDRAPAHAASPGYGVQRFVDDATFLSDVVRFDVPRLGDISGLTGIHLQCHIGTDTISLARLGARMTGLDLSGVSIGQARSIAARVQPEVMFVEGEVYSAPQLLDNETFDLVYTGIGALCWLPDIRRWAGVVQALLKPGGRLFIREGHPVLWALDDTRTDDLLVMGFPYFETAEALASDEDSTYVQVDRPFEATRNLSWNHGIGEIVTALLDAGLRLTMLVEHETVPWTALPGRMVDTGSGEWALADRRWRAPMTYTLQAVKQ